MINTAMFCKCHSGKGGLKPSGVPTSLRGTRGTKLRYQELGKSESVLHFYLSTLSLIKIEWTKGLLKIQQVKNTTNLPTTFPRVSRRFNLSGAGLVARDKSALFDNGKNLQITQKKFVLVILMLCCWCFVTIILWCFDVSFFLLILLIEIQPISLPPGKKSIFHQMLQPTGYLFRFRENLLTIWRAVGSPMSRHWHQIQGGFLESQ